MEYEYNLFNCTVSTNETMMNGQRQRQRQMKKKKSRGDGRTPASRGGHASCRGTSNSQRSTVIHVCTVCCIPSSTIEWVK